jgi:hypothetical protein
LKLGAHRALEGVPLVSDDLGQDPKALKTLGEALELRAEMAFGPLCVGRRHGAGRALDLAEPPDTWERNDGCKG